MASSISAKASVKEVLLSDQSTWDGWYENIKGSVPDYLWKYFDPDDAAIFVEPIPPVEPLIEPPPHPAPTSGPTTRNSQPPGETPEHRAGCESKYKEDMDISVWQRVPGVAGYFDEVEQKVVQGKQHKYLLSDITFATGVTFDGKEASNVEDTAATATAATKELKPADTTMKNKNKNKRKKNNREGRNNNSITSQNQSQPRGQSQRDRSCSPVPETRPHPRRANWAEKRDGKQVRELCLACGGTSHSFTRCYLVQGQDKDWIPNENRETFRSNMKVATFKRRVDDFKASQKSFEN
ncbi:hypothetical protein MMC31_006145 [Peltigera leucophlebia]|nr:hypothetical protein [Peltigera leucophlebia]